MTAIAADTDFRERKRRPLTAHPWFAAALGLWCGALLGLCALVLPVGVIEGLAAATGLDRVIPSATPPLGQTARLLIVLGVSGVGEIVGLTLAALLARRHRSAPRRPLSAHEDLVIVEPVAADEPEPPAEAAPEQVIAAPSISPVALAPLETLGVVQLSERLAVAMAARRAGPERPARPARNDARTLHAAMASLQRVSGAR